jgi:hypothetical protein
MDPKFATLLSDYRFCEYRLNIIRHHPDLHSGVIAALIARIENLASQCPEVRDRFSHRPRTG